MENSKQKILILDGSIKNIDELASMLEQSDRIVFKTTSEDEGARIISDEKVDLLVTDPHHYNDNTKKLFDALLKSDGGEVPVLFAVDTQEEESRLLKEFNGHTVDFIKKPAEASKITSRVNLLLEIKSLRAELSKCRHEAETSIKAKEVQVNASAQELQSFVYTVSHDLRAPLRAINGFTQIIEEEYGKDFQPEGLRLFGMIKQNAQKMGRLIDDLLTFSRLARKQVVFDPVNMSDVAYAAVIESEKAQSHHAKLTTGELLPAKGDFSLLKQAFMNLLSNAIKFSSKKESPEIEIGSYKSENELVYFVKDNGVGFNMAYSDKLFGVFQRLHSEGEFEGTGIGLAMVKRIIGMHGGRVWAEGKADEGATFYFSLPEK